MSDRSPEVEDEAVRPSSPEVVRVLVENHRRFLSFLEKRVGSREVAEDILQDAFVRGLPASVRVRDEESAVAWFYRSLRNAVVDHWRRRAAEGRAIEKAGAQSSEAVPPVDDDALRDQACACVLDLLPTIKPEYAEALRRVDVEEMSVKAFAESAGITANNASVRLLRGRQALRRQVVRSCGTCADHGCLDCSCGRPAGPAP